MPRVYAEKFTPEQKAEIVARYNAGAGFNELAAHYDCSIATVYKTVRRSPDAKVRGQGRRPKITPETESEVVRLRGEGLNSRRIADALGLTTIQVSRALKRHGLASNTIGPGPNSTGWKGGRIKGPGGYVGVWIDPSDPLHVMAWHNHYVPEHRLVVARSLGRPLLQTETVHHINGDKTDNRLENLQLRQGWHGKGARFTCLDCGSHNVKAVSI